MTEENNKPMLYGLPIETGEFPPIKGDKILVVGNPHILTPDESPLSIVKECERLTSTLGNDIIPTSYILVFPHKYMVDKKAMTEFKSDTRCSFYNGLS